MHGHRVKGNVLHRPPSPHPGRHLRWIRSVVCTQSILKLTLKERPPLGLVVGLSVSLSQMARQLASPFWLSLLRASVLTLPGVSSWDKRLLSPLRAFVLTLAGASSWDKRLTLDINHFGLMVQLGPGWRARLLTYLVLSNQTLARVDPPRMLRHQGGLEELV